MRAALAACAFVLIAGCRTVLPSAVEAEGAGQRAARTEHALEQEPHRAAACIARSIDRDWPGVTARIREGNAPALVQIDVRAGGLVSLVQLFVAGNGSTAVIWIAPGQRVDVNALITGC